MNNKELDVKIEQLGIAGDNAFGIYETALDFRTKVIDCLEGVCPINEDRNWANYDTAYNLVADTWDVYCRVTDELEMTILQRENNSE